MASVYFDHVTRLAKSRTGHRQRQVPVRSAVKYSEASTLFRPRIVSHIGRIDGSTAIE